MQKEQIKKNMLVCMIFLILFAIALFFAGYCAYLLYNEELDKPAPPVDGYDMHDYFKYEYDAGNYGENNAETLIMLEPPANPDFIPEAFHMVTFDGATWWDNDLGYAIIYAQEDGQEPDWYLIRQISGYNMRWIKYDAAYFSKMSQAKITQGLRYFIMTFISGVTGVIFLLAAVAVCIKRRTV